MLHSYQTCFFWIEFGECVDQVAFIVSQEFFLASVSRDDWSGLDLFKRHVSFALGVMVDDGISGDGKDPGRNTFLDVVAFKGLERFEKNVLNQILGHLSSSTHAKIDEFIDPFDMGLVKGQKVALFCHLGSTVLYTERPVKCYSSSSSSNASRPITNRSGMGAISQNERPISPKKAC